MRKIATAALLSFLLPAAARAGEGVYITIDGGYGSWGNKEEFKSRLATQVGNDPSVTGLSNTALLVDRQLPDGGLFGLHLGYNIGGHVAFEGSLMIRPYDILADTRGGAGITGMAARWYPLQGLIRPNRQFDFSLLAGMDYVISGGNGIHGPVTAQPDKTDKDKIANSGRGFDAMAVELGGTLELYPAKWVSLGLTPRVYVMDPMRYFVSFDNRDVGGQIPLTGKGSLMLYSFSLSISFHFEPLPD